MLSGNNDWQAVEKNLQWAQVKWRQIVKLLGREVVDRRTEGRFYVAVVQAVLLFGLETWVVTPWLENSLMGFYHWVVRRMVGMVPKCQLDGTWVYPPIGTALAKVGLDDVGVYIARLQNMVAQCIADYLIMDLENVLFV